MSTIKAGTTTTTAFSVDQDTTGDLNFQAGSVTPLSIKSTGLVSVSNTASFKLPVGTIAQRPASPQNGMMRFNSDMNEVEVYSGGAWQVISSGNLKLKLDFDETTTLDSRISFTRATNGTYFDSAGVLQTAGSGVARFDHRLENGSWVNKGLLIEEARTNLFLRSEELNNATWFKFETSITQDNTTAPDGTTTAERMTSTGTSNPSAYQQLSSFTAGSTYTGSIWLKAGNINQAAIQLYRNSGGDVAVESASVLSGPGTITGAGIGASTVYVSGLSTDQWTRISVTGTPSSGGSFALYVKNRLSGATNGDYLFVWGAQMELGTFATSYIKTTSSSVTRNADVATMTSTNFSSWYNQTEGTIFCQGQYNGITLNPRFWEVSDGTGQERLFLAPVSSASPANAFRYAVVDANLTQAGIDSSFAAAINQNYKTAVVYKVNDFALGIDGSLIGTVTSGTLPTVNRISFGTDFVATGSFTNGHIAKFYYWNTRRPNQVLQNLTE